MSRFSRKERQPPGMIVHTASLKPPHLLVDFDVVCGRFVAWNVLSKGTVRQIRR